jgi:primary-amine oxidase
MAQYSGNNPHQATTVWLDRAFGMGGQVREVIIGYDCPYDATLLSATIHEGGSSVRPNAICIFEQERSTPLSRHVGFDKDESGAVKGYELVVRSISTVGNYDYIFDYTYQLDGTLEIRVSASGYLQGGAWDESEDPYGHRLNRESMGSLHDHVINCELRDEDDEDDEDGLIAQSRWTLISWTKATR